MPTIQEYQRYRVQRHEPHTRPKKLLGWAVIVIGGVLVVMAFAGGRGDKKQEGQIMANENTNSTAETTETNGNANTNTDANTNTAQASNGSFAGLDALLADYVPTASCPQAISRPGSNEVLLTFGLRLSGADYAEVLATLQENQVPAAFFASGVWATAHPDVLNAVTDAGFPVYNQTQTHEDLTTLSEDVILTELEQADENISIVTGRSTKPFMRPPYGAIDDAVFAAVTSAGYCPVLWGVDGLDWQEGATSFDVVTRVMDAVSSRGLVLLQVGSAPTATALPEIIRRVREQGMQFVSLEQVATAE